MLDNTSENAFRKHQLVPFRAPSKISEHENNIFEKPHSMKQRFGLFIHINGSSEKITSSTFPDFKIIQISIVFLSFAVVHTLNANFQAIFLASVVYWSTHCKFSILLSSALLICTVSKKLPGRPCAFRGTGESIRSSAGGFSRATCGN